ncbi:MAG: phosphoglucomutase [Desulfurococcales archaeon]|nr:phosphoglucomutase [Desulfurococcales archaeon]
MPRLFGTAGIRGRYLDKVTPDLAYRVGLAVASYLGGKGSATIGHDVRTTSPLLAQMAAAGLMAGGLNVISLGVAPTPVVAYSIPATKSRSGIVITASHNPPPYNGIKVFDSSGMEYTLAMEEQLEDIIDRMDESKFKSIHASWDRVGRLTAGEEIISDYIRDLSERMHVAKPKVGLKLAVDCANGTASNVTPVILREIGVEKLVSINCHQDGMFPGRYPEPRPDVLSAFIKSVRELGMHALLAHDGDADRLALAIPGIGFIKQDLLIALFSLYKLRESKGTIIVSVDVGLEVEEIVESLGGRLVRAKLGKIHEKLKETPGALLAAEPWKLIDPSWGPWVDGIYQAALLAKIALEEGETPLDMILKLPFYPSARVSIRIGNDDAKSKLYSRAKDRFESQLSIDAVGLLDIDGIRIEYGDRSWILLRASGTESKIRIYSQSPNKERLLELVEKAKKLIIEEARSMGITVEGVEEQIDLGFSIQRTTPALS